MGIVVALNSHPFYSGSGISSEVPGSAPVSLNGHKFLIDESIGIRHPPLPFQREQADTATVPGEQTVSRDELWRRAQETWHRGAGQDYLDRPDSDPARFRSSKGIDVWTRWRMTNLPATDAKRTSAATNLNLAVAGTRLFLTDGTGIVWTDDITVDSPTWTAMTGTPGTSWTSITSDGFYVYATDGTNIYRFERDDAGVGAAWNAADADLLVWVRGKGRLMGAHESSAFNVVDTSAPADIKPSTISTDFRWVGFAEGPSVIYGAGFQGDKSLIYRWGIKADGTGLDAAVPALADGLPDGEIVRSIGSYLGFVLIGTDKGLRFAISGTDGNLEVGALIDEATTVRCFEGQERFVWFGWSDYDSVSTGLGRLDLSVLNDTAPAWASDLMAGAQGDVLSVVTFGNRRVFTVSGSGVWAQDSALEPTATLDSGDITFDMADTKIAMYLDVRHDALEGSHGAYLSTDGGDFVAVGTDMTDSEVDVFPVGQKRGGKFEVRHELNRDDTDTTTAPSVTRSTLRAYPAPASRGVRMEVPLILAESNIYNDGVFTMDPVAELAFLKELRATRNPINYQEGTTTYTVYVDDLDWRTHHQTFANKGWHGVAVVSLKQIVA